ncbi:MAG: hypothetical protein ABSF14_14230 [Terriglobia bacterium]|jgi:hypothetical protein
MLIKIGCKLSPLAAVVQAAEKRFHAVILSAVKDLALPAQDKLREGSRSAHFRGNARFFVACGSSE